MGLKRRLACEWNLLELRKHAKQLYMWTPTFPYFARPSDVRGMVREFIQYLNRHGANGVRVYENHDNGSLHLHIVTDKFFWVRQLRAYWESLGGGRIHVKFLNPDDAGFYIAKELMKTTQRAWMEKGTRVYATFGKLWKQIGKTLISNIGFSGDGFVSYLWSTGQEKWSQMEMFSFGLEHFGVGYATVSGMNRSPATEGDGDGGYASTGVVV